VYINAEETGKGRVVNEKSRDCISPRTRGWSHRAEGAIFARADFALRIMARRRAGRDLMAALGGINSQRPGY